MRLDTAFACFISIVVLEGCWAAEPSGVLAMNLRTGESRRFSDAESVAEGWVICADDVCPDPLPCEDLDEDSCLVRQDCTPIYAELWPQECEQPDPPDYCTDLPYVGCGSIGGGGEGEGEGEGEGGCDDLPGCEFQCPPGFHNPVDRDGCVHTCECEPDEDECDEAECGPAPLCPAIQCDDGTLGGCTGRCLRGEDGTCGWEIRECPDSTECTPEECGPAPLANPQCPDGGDSTTECLRGDDGTCGWQFSCGA